MSLNRYLYNLGASAGEEWPPNIHTLPTTNQTAKKQSKAILKWSTNPLSLQISNQILHFVTPDNEYEKEELLFCFTFWWGCVKVEEGKIQKLHILLYRLLDCTHYSKQQKIYTSADFTLQTTCLDTNSVKSATDSTTVNHTWENQPCQYILRGMMGKHKAILTWKPWVFTGILLCLGCLWHVHTCSCTHTGHEAGQSFHSEAWKLA